MDEQEFFGPEDPEGEENLSGAFDAEEQQWQEMLKSDPGFAAFLDLNDAESKKERERG